MVNGERQAPEDRR